MDKESAGDWIRWTTFKTVGELLDLIKDFPRDAPVNFSEGRVALFGRGTVPDCIYLVEENASQRDI